MTARQVLDAMLRTSRVLYGALVAATVLLAAISFIVKPDVPQPIQPLVEIYIAVAAVGVAVTSFVFPAKALATSAARTRMEVVPSGVTMEGLPMPPRFADPLGAARRAMAAAQTSFILSLALSEAVSLFGLVLHMLGAPRPVSLPFFVAGTVLAALRFPTLSRFVAPFERAHGASFAASMDGTG